METNEGRNQTSQKRRPGRKRKAWAFAAIDEYEESRALYVGETYTLTANMGWGDVPATAKKAASTQFHLPESHEPLSFGISVWAEDMDIEPPRIRTLELEPASDSPAQVQFKFIPKAVGQKVINVNLYYQLRWLRQIAFEVKVEFPSITPGITDKPVISAQPLRVAMLLGHGRRGDRSFNDSAYAGLESAREQYGIEFETADSGALLEENVALLQRWAEADCDLIIAIGYHNGPAIAQVAESFPQKRFAIIDTEAEGENVWSAVFREYETDYVVGALAALIAGKGGRVGFIGGVRTPIIHRIEFAFSQGIESVNPDVVLNTIYVDKFDDETMGQYFAEMLYAIGADVIYQAAGRSGIGAIRAAKKLGKLVISTGGDHSELAPAAVITSRIKNVHRPVLDVIEAVVKDHFQGGQTASYGLANGGLELVPVRREVVKRLVEHLPSDVSLHDFITRLAEITKRATSGQLVIDFDEVEEMVPGLADGQSFDEELSDEK